ncbi:FtsK/SpoIIIE domain-containing protein [Pseudonocardia sp. ICBG601]|uniref:FtsK/SpoIIIE domain-containing protein n=1 Tax=Pseudonocardia sp. ICBG601 TaxID=2846759 RepID=UPI001CF6C9A3|nr:FtsK/SpoIIIE domain-containing protein [Pseudonocardia sp. ICBG601]
MSAAIESGTVGSGSVLRRETPGQVVVSERAERVRAGVWARRVPYLATAATAATGTLGWALCDLVAASDGPTVATAAAGGLGVTVAAGLAAARGWWRRRIPAAWTKASWAGVAGAGAWVGAAALTGPADPALLAALAAGAAACWSGWMAAHPVTVPSPGPVLPDEGAGDVGDRLARRWADNVARRGKALPDSLLTDRVDTARSIRWTVRTPPGEVCFDDILGRRSRIASALGVSGKHLVVEPFPDDEGWAQLTVITADVLSVGIAYTGPRYESGTVPLGPYADGEGEMVFHAVEAVGVRNGLVTGEPGSGKSACLEAIGLGLASSGRWHVFFGDGDPDGGSSPVLNDVADWAESGPDGVLAQLAAVEAALEVRSLLKSTLTEGPPSEDGGPGALVAITDPAVQSPARKLLPTPELPGLMWIIDELHRLSTHPHMVAADFIGRLERVVRIGRKYGVGLVVGTQSLLAPDFGGSTVLRSFLTARNLFAFRNMNRSENAVIDGLAVAPTSLPSGGGYCFANSGGRMTMGRVAWAEDLGPWVRAVGGVVLDPDTAAAVGPFQPVQSVSPQARWETQTAKLAAWRRTTHTGAGAAGELAPEAPAPELSAPSVVSVVALPGWAGVAVPAALTAADVVPLPAPAEETVASAEVAEHAGLSSAQREVYAALAAGHTRTGDIAAVTGRKAPAVSKALTALASAGLAVKTGRYWSAVFAEVQVGA